MSKMNENKILCFDCLYMGKQPDTMFKVRTEPGDTCEHFTPEYWVKQGYEDNWGDAALVGENVRILKRVTGTQADFMILDPRLRRPVHLYASGKNLTAHGGY